MKAVLGVSVAAHTVRAVQLVKDRMAWAGEASYERPDDLDELIGTLVAQAPHPARRVRAVLERDCVQLRTIPAPPVRASRARRYVVLQADALFRRNGAALVVDALPLRTSAAGPVLWAGAAAQPLVEAVVKACERSGLVLEALGPASEVLPHAMDTAPADGEVRTARDGVCETLAVEGGRVWRSRLAASAGDGTAAVWAEPLRSLGDGGGAFAAAYGSALARPRLSLLPAEARAARLRVAERRAAGLLGAAAVLWLAAGAVHVGRLAMAAVAAERELTALEPDVERALAARRDLDRTERAVATVHEIERDRSRTLALLAALTDALPDSAHLVAMRIGADSTVALEVYAPQAPATLAALQRTAGLRQVRLDGDIARERIDGGAAARERDRFRVVARIGGGP